MPIILVRRLDIGTELAAETLFNLIKNHEFDG